ncbi:MAG: chemotaxis protein CheW [Burkholderiaceae bacterium]
MANKEALRELQSRLAERLQAARTQSQGQSWLAVECGGMGLLLPLREAGEIFALAPIVPVPHSHPWFLGVANLRGYLHGVVDLAGFLGVRSQASSRDQAGRDPSRLVGFNPEYGVNCALRVDRLAGLRSEDELAPQTAEGGPRPAFVGMRMRDGAGRLWQELLMSALARDETFLRIVG